MNDDNGRRQGARGRVWLVAAGAGAALAAREALRRRREGAYALRDRTILITGGSRGLGLEIARLCAAEGARLVLAARDPAELERARAELAGRGAEVLTVPCDLTDRAQIDALVRAALDRFGRIDVLINNAGVIQVGPLDSATEEDFAEALGVHFWAPLRLTRAVLPGMRARGEGHIVNIASFGGKVSVPHLLPYSASKFALVGLSEGLRAELARDGVAVTTVCPGLLRTGSHRNAFFKGRHRAEYAWFSLGGANPLLSMGSGRAARQIVAACRRGDAELVISGQAQFAGKFHGLFPGFTADALAAVDRLLPGPGGIGAARARGSESETPLTRSPLTANIARAAERNNETGG